MAHQVGITRTINKAKHLSALLRDAGLSKEADEYDAAIIAYEESVVPDPATPTKKREPSPWAGITDPNLLPWSEARRRMKIRVLLKRRHLKNLLVKISADKSMKHLDKLILKYKINQELKDLIL